MSFSLQPTWKLYVLNSIQSCSWHKWVSNTAINSPTHLWWSWLVKDSLWRLSWPSYCSDPIQAVQPSKRKVEKQRSAIVQFLGIQKPKVSFFIFMHNSATSIKNWHVLCLVLMLTHSRTGSLNLYTIQSGWHLWRVLYLPMSLMPFHSNTERNTVQSYLVHKFNCLSDFRALLRQGTHFVSAAGVVSWQKKRRASNNTKSFVYIKHMSQIIVKICFQWKKWISR